MVAMEELDYDGIFGRIEYLLDELAISKSAFAQSIGISLSRLNNLLKGSNKPTLEVLFLISKAYPRYSLEWLINGKEPSVAAPTASAEGRLFTEEGEPLFLQNDEATYPPGRVLQNSAQVSWPENAPSAGPSTLPQGVLTGQLSFSKEEVATLKELLQTQLSAPERIVQEIRVFYTDQSFEVFRRIDPEAAK